MSRRYRQKRRAEQQEETRRRIVQAAMELHQEVGPAQTSIRAIADRAGVQRLTVYRHFPDERSLFQACSAHYASLHPLPSFERWAEISDPESRVRTALTELYEYYERTEPMLEKIFQDVSRVRAVAEVFHETARAMNRAQQILVDGWAINEDVRQRRLMAVIGHAMAFETWQSLVRRQGLSNIEAVETMVSLVRVTALGSGSPS